MAVEKARQAAGTAKEAASDTAATAKKAARRTAKAAKKAGRTVRGSTRKAVGTVRAVSRARAGLVEDAREVAEDAGLEEGVAADAIAQAEGLHYQVEVNKRGLSAGHLTKTLNQRWDNGWRLAHILEQRGNTVLVFEKRD